MRLANVRLQVLARKLIELTNFALVDKEKPINAKSDDIALFCVEKGYLVYRSSTKLQYAGVFSRGVHILLHQFTNDYNI